MVPRRATGVADAVRRRLSAATRLDARVWRVLILVALVGAPAVALRIACAGRACAAQTEAPSTTPFCSLPEPVRDRIVRGFYDGRSPDVMVVSRTRVRGADRLAGLPVPWPSLGRERGDRVPILFAGAGVEGGARVPAGTGPQDVAPTLAEILRLRRPHPSVRSGEPVPDVGTGASRPRLLVAIVLKGIGSPDLEPVRDLPPNLARLFRTGTGTLDGAIGDLPLDPAATLTTLGTGGVPSEHGITGTFVLGDEGAAVPAWGPQAPPSVIATLGDHLDELMGHRPMIGIVATDPSDRGAIGGTWYPDDDRDDVIVGGGGARVQTSAAVRMLSSGYGEDATPDLLVVVLRDGLAAMDRAVGRIERAATRASGGDVTVVVTATGSARPRGDRYVSGAEVRRRIQRDLPELEEGIDAVVAGGLFLDQRLLASGAFSEEQVVAALRRLKAGDGGPVFADVFRSTSVTFARYC